MSIVEAAAWGLAGGAAAGLVALSASILKARYRWPWRGNPDGVWPRLVVAVAGIAVGALVAAAAHSQMSGAWPAFLLGVGAPSVIRGVITRIEVEEGTRTLEGPEAEAFRPLPIPVQGTMPDGVPREGGDS
jgi:uncharacterized membrane protein YfcA